MGEAQACPDSGIDLWLGRRNGQDWKCRQARHSDIGRVDVAGDCVPAVPAFAVAPASPFVWGCRKLPIAAWG